MKSATMERPALDTLRARLTELRAMQREIPNKLADAEARLTAAKDEDRRFRQEVIRVRALVEIGEVSPSDARAVEHAAGRAAENLRDAEDQLATIVETLPALAKAQADTLEAYRASRLPALRDETTRAVDRIDRAWTELLAAFDAAQPLADEISRDWRETTSATGYVTIDARLQYTLPGVLGFSSKQRVPALAERWRALKARG
jgi:hypothetical protein